MTVELSQLHPNFIRICNDFGNTYSSDHILDFSCFFSSILFLRNAYQLYFFLSSNKPAQLRWFGEAAESVQIVLHIFPWCLLRKVLISSRCKIAICSNSRRNIWKCVTLLIIPIWREISPIGITTAGYSAIWIQLNGGLTEFSSQAKSL